MRASRRACRHGAALLVAVAIGGMAARGAPERLTADLDGDGRPEQVALDTAHKHALGVYRSGRCVARAVLSTWKPWRLRLADVEGDGRTEIVVGVHKPTRFIPHAHNCVFVYWFDGREIMPRWLGSSLSRPFTDFAFAPPASGRAWTLYAVERARSGRSSLAEYGWNGFGFTVARRSGDWHQARIVSVDKRRIVVAADGRRLRFDRRTMRAGEARERKGR